MDDPPVANNSAPPFFVEFLRKYRDSPSLWNSKSQEYLDKRAKEEAITDLIEVCKKHNLVDASRGYVLRKIYTCRMAFRKELMKLECLNNSSGKGTRRRALWYFKHMSFLKDLELSYLGLSRPLRTAPRFRHDNDNDRDVKIFDGIPFGSDGRTKKGTKWICLHQHCDARVIVGPDGDVMAQKGSREHNHPPPSEPPIYQPEYVECNVDLDGMFTAEEHDTKDNIIPQVTSDSPCSGTSAIPEVVVETTRAPRRAKKRKIYIEGEEDEDNDEIETHVRVKPTPNHVSSVSSSPQDEYDIYGQLIAAKLKKMDDRTRDIAMNKIDNVLFQLKMNPAKDDKASCDCVR